ncbi:DUF1289 domain-containing protein [Vibrio diazotrophicus]|uniref:DUF1289 domain-containing protein n=1 Tax=Vibrio diazotrophicus TaxID=685 RepID=UPI00142E34D0|nr:DUF1289 domain-containing protein [Vibrio diazotrophicus]NIY91070.1 DUF1289 domain-containing protein [Vibrio diazotrophicus]
MSLKADSGAGNSPASPCIRQCCLDEQDICVGCFRSLEEIIHWSASSDAEKKQIIERCKQRKVQRKRC